MKVRYLLNLNVEESEILLDFDYKVILVNRIYLRKFLLDFKIRKLFFLY